MQILSTYLPKSTSFIPAGTDLAVKLLSTLVILVTSTQHAHLTLHVSLRLAKRPSAQFANSTNNVLWARTTFKHQSHYSPTSSQGRVLVEQASVPVYLTRFAVIFFPTSRSTWENKKNTTDELRTRTTFQRFLNQEYFFGSRVMVFSRDPSCWSIGSYVPFSTRKPHAKAVP